MMRDKGGAANVRGDGKGSSRRAAGVGRSEYVSMAWGLYTRCCKFRAVLPESRMVNSGLCLMNETYQQQRNDAGQGPTRSETKIKLMGLTYHTHPPNIRGIPPRK